MTEPQHATDSIVLTDRMKAATRQVHERLERELDVMRPDLTMSQYVHQLTRWYGFCRTWERIGASAFEKTSKLFFEARRKSHLLRRDLLACGLSPRALAKLPCSSRDALDFKNSSAAIGTLYVIEGSTLGGAFIAKHVAGRLHLKTERGLAYFTSYGDARGARWAETRKLINHPPFDISSDQAVRSAVDTFEYLATWLQRDSVTE